MEIYIIRMILIAFTCFFLGFLFESIILMHYSYINTPHVMNQEILRSSHRNNDLKAMKTEKPIKMNQNKQIIIQKDLELIQPIISIASKEISSHSYVPDIVKAWREAKLDWHDLIPKHNSKWERFGTPKTEGKLNLLVNKEIQVTDYLTRFYESGLSSRYGHNHGNFISYSGCDVFSSPCMIHDNLQCSTNGFCQWDDLSSLCIDKNHPSNTRRPSTCISPQIITELGVSDVSDISTCKVWINDDAVFLKLDSESQVN